MAQIPGTPEIVLAGLSELWMVITPDCIVRSQRCLNQSCSPCRDLSNAMLHSRIECREGIDSRLLVVGSQIASLTPGPSFAHNLGCRCPNGQCEAIFNIYVSRSFQWPQENPNARCFAPFCRALNIRESRRTPTPNFFKCWASPPHLAKVGLRQCRWRATHCWKALKESYKFASDLIPIGGLNKNLWTPKVPGVQTETVLGLHFGSPGKKCHLDASAAE
jgi:hypothetical protein